MEAPEVFPDTATASPPDRVLAGVGWMLLTGILFIAVTGVVRHIGSTVPFVQAAFIRYAFGTILIAPAALSLWWSGRVRPPSRPQFVCYGLRGLSHGIGVMLWFYAIGRIAITEVTAIGYITPIFTTIGAALFLRETLHLRRILAVLIGFVGVLIILRPGLQIVAAGSLAQLLTGPFFALSYILAKRLTDSRDSVEIVVMLSIVCTLVLLPGALWQWRTLTNEELYWLLLTALLATSGHYTLTRAFACAPITVTQPITFVQLVWATLLGYFVFGEYPDMLVILGGAVIVAAATYIAHREAVAARRKRRQLNADIVRTAPARKGPWFAYLRSSGRERG